MRSLRRARVLAVLAIGLSLSRLALAGETAWLERTLAALETASGMAVQTARSTVAGALAPAAEHLLEPAAGMHFSRALTRLDPELALCPEALDAGLPLPLAFDGPLFGVPMTRFEPPPGHERLAVLGLAGELGAFSDALAGARSTGYDWVFPKVYRHVTDKAVEYAATGRFLRPRIVYKEIGQFYAVYAMNARGWLAAGAVEREWAVARDLSRALARLDGPAGPHDTKASNMAVLVASMYAHIAVDLPRCLLVVYYTDRDKPTQKLLQADFQRMTPLFDEVSTLLIGEGRITPEVLAKLPPLLRAGISRLGVGPFVKLMRVYAWERFEWYARRGRFKDQVEALHGAPVVPGLPGKGRL